MALQHNEANASSMSEKWHEDNQAQAEEYIGRNDYHEHHYQTPEEETRLQSDLKIHLHLNHLPLGCQERNVSDGHELGRRSNSRGDQRMDEKGTTRSSRYFEDLRFFKSVIHPSIHPSQAYYDPPEGQKRHYDRPEKGSEEHEVIHQVHSLCRR